MHLKRRDFVKTCAYTGMALESGSLFSRNASAADGPKMCIARYGSPSEEEAKIKEEAEKLTRSIVEAMGGMKRFVSSGDVVWVKPNIGWNRRPEQAANTNPDVIATLVKLCKQAGASEIIVGDNTCNPARQTYARSGIQQAAEEAGANVVFLDKRKYKKYSLDGKVLKEWELYRDIVRADKFINVPIAKHHRLSEATLGMKNLMGIIGGNRGQYHQDIRNTLADLSAFIKPDLTIVDGIRVLLRNGPVGGNLEDVKRQDTLVAGTDQVAVDAFAATLLGRKPEDISHIVEADIRGLGTIDYKSLNPKEITV